jgi:hypothetical protein
MQTVINISYYKQLDTVIDSIYGNISHLTSIHKSLIDEATCANSIHDYTIYIDDLFFQKSILSKEVEHLSLLKQLSIRRFYASLFKLYQHVTQTYIEVIRDRYIGGFGSPEHMRVFYNEPRIRLYNEIDVITLYSYIDIETISASIRFYTDTLQGQLQQMEYEISDLEVKMSKGYHVHSILSAYRNEHLKYTNNVKTYFQLFNSIQTMNISVVQRFILRAKIIRDEIHDNLSIDGQTIDSDISGSKVSAIHVSDSDTTTSSQSDVSDIPNDNEVNRLFNADSNHNEPRINLKIDIPNSNTLVSGSTVQPIAIPKPSSSNISEDDVSLLSKYGNSSIERAMTELIQQNMSNLENMNPDSPTDSLSESPISHPTIFGDESDTSPDYRIRINHMEGGATDDDSENANEL